MYLDEPGTVFGATVCQEGFYTPLIGVAQKPIPQGLMVDCNMDGRVNVMGGGKDFSDEFIHPGRIPMTNRVKCINGYAYTVGNDRKIYKRVDIGQWEMFAKLSAKRHEDFNISDYGFSDMDAFNETDMYAVGGRGDVWHFDGKAWTQQQFPTKDQLATVTCAGDGHVYISGEGGTLWRGSLSSWERIYKGNSSILWNDVLWFDNKLWLSSDYEAKIWDGKQMQPITHNGEEVDICGHMDAYTEPETGEGLLVIASPWYVMAFDKKEWRTLVAPYDEGEDDYADEDEYDEV